MPPSTKLAPVLAVVETAKSVFRSKLQAVATSGGMMREMDLRGLAFQ